jgi:hypothetical protein
MSRKIAAVTLAVLAATAPAAFADYAGKSTNRNGTVRLHFTTQRMPNLATLTLSSRLARNNRLKPFTIECRTADGEYASVVTIAATRNGQRKLQAPAELPAGATRCRVRKSGKTVATIRVRRT